MALSIPSAKQTVTALSLLGVAFGGSACAPIGMQTVEPHPESCVGVGSLSIGWIFSVSGASYDEECAVSLAANSLINRESATPAEIAVGMNVLAQEHPAFRQALEETAQAIANGEDPMRALLLNGAVISCQVGEMRAPGTWSLEGCAGLAGGQTRAGGPS